MVCSSPFNGLLFLKAYQCSWVVQQYDDQVCPQKDGLWVSDSEHRCKIFWFLQRGTITKYCSTVFILGFLLGLDFLSVKTFLSSGRILFFGSHCVLIVMQSKTCMVDWHFQAFFTCRLVWFANFFSLCQDMHTSSWGSHWLPLTTITTCQESQLKERMGGTWSSKIFKTITEVSCRNCEGKEVLQLLPFFICKMLQRRSQMEGSFSQPSDRNEFDPKQIAPTLAMKEPPPTEVLMKGPSRFVKKSL